MKLFQEHFSNQVSVEPVHSEAEEVPLEFVNVSILGKESILDKKYKNSDNNRNTDNIIEIITIEKTRESITNLRRR